MSFENAFNFYYTRWLDNKLSNLIKDEKKEKQLESTFSKLKENITIPDALLKKHVGISPIAQQELYLFLNSETKFKKFIPDDIHSDNAVESFQKIVEIVNTHLSGDFNGVSYYHASLIVRWIRGYKLSFMIQKSLKYWGKRKKRDSVIRDVMADIETYARFKFAKYSSCYMDILRLVLKEKGKDHAELERNFRIIFLE